MPKKKKRCSVKSCSVVIPECYHFCYMHRKWSHADVVAERLEPGKSFKPYRRFFCDECGTVSHAYAYTHCKSCGRATEEVGAETVTA